MQSTSSRSTSDDRLEKYAIGRSTADESSFFSAPSTLLVTGKWRPEAHFSLFDPYGFQGFLLCTNVHKPVDVSVRTSTSDGRSGFLQGSSTETLAAPSVTTLSAPRESIRPVCGDDAVVPRYYHVKYIPQIFHIFRG